LDNKTSIKSSCSLCRYREENCQGMENNQNEPCLKFERYGEFLARELSFVDREFVVHQVLGLSLAVLLGLGMTWVLGHLA